VSSDKIIQKCDLCDASYQHGPHRYEGRKAHRYGIMVCDGCWSGNWDGWNISYDKKLLAALEENDFPVPERNSKGFLPRE